MNLIEGTQSSHCPYPVGSNVSIYYNYITEVLPKLMQELKNYGKSYQLHINLWCTGSSGAILSTLLLVKLVAEGYTVHVCHVKKDGEDSHSSKTIARDHGDFVNIVVDDFVVTGASIERIYRHMESVLPLSKSMIHILLAFDFSKWIFNFEPTTVISSVSGIHTIKSYLNQPKKLYPNEKPNISNAIAANDF